MNLGFQSYIALKIFVSSIILLKICLIKKNLAYKNHDMNMFCISKYFTIFKYSYQATKMCKMLDYLDLLGGIFCGLRVSKIFDTAVIQNLKL
jgi:hypothetical protein